jgi:hypothetical protein
MTADGPQTKSHRLRNEKAMNRRKHLRFQQQRPKTKLRTFPKDEPSRSAQRYDLIGTDEFYASLDKFRNALWSSGILAKVNVPVDSFRIQELAVQQRCAFWSTGYEADRVQLMEVMAALPIALGFTRVGAALCGVDATGRFAKFINWPSRAPG